MNGYAEIAIAAYLLAVLLAKNETKLIELFKGEGPFVKWALAFGLVVAVTGKLGQPGQQFLTMVIIALLMTAVSKNAQLFSSLTAALSPQG